MSIFQNVLSESRLFGLITAKTLLEFTKGSIAICAGLAVHGSLPSHKLAENTHVLVSWGLRVRNPAAAQLGHL